MKRVGIICMSAFILLAGCAKKQTEPVSRSAFLLNTFVTVTMYDSEDEAILDGAIALCESYEDVFSKTIQGSQVYQLNNRDKSKDRAELSDDMADILKKGLYYSQVSDGDFDITIEPLSSLWDFTSGENIVPNKNQIITLANEVDYKNLKLDGNTLTFLSPDTTIDLGAIAKGYIADKMKEYMMEQGVESAIINLGGNVLCIGNKPDGSPFKIGLQKPFADRSETIETLKIEDMSVVSSGVYERHFIVDGVNYHHILNPRTGFPYENGLTAVTVLSKDSVDGDGLSTACFSMGLEKGMELIESMDGVYGFFITEDGEVHYSKGAESFVIQ